MSDHDILLCIQELLDGVEWTPETLKEIAELLNNNGYRIRDPDDRDVPPRIESIRQADPQPLPRLVRISLRVVLWPIALVALLLLLLFVPDIFDGSL